MSGLRPVSILALLAAGASPSFGQSLFTLTLTNNPSTSTFGQTVTLTCTASSTASGTVTFYEVFISTSGNRTPIGQANFSGTTATFPVSSLSAGTHQLNASYTNANQQTFTSNTVSQTVNKATPPVSVSSQPDPSTYGQPVTLTATLDSRATGTVTFFDGSNQIGSANLSNGTATFTTTSLAAGSHNLSAGYPGDNNFNSSSGRTTQTINQASSTATLSSSPNPSSVGQLVIITATVTGPGATGTVTFFDGQTALGTAVLGNGSAGISSATLSAGDHILTATYSGDNNYIGSTAKAITQTVGRNATQTSLSVSPNPANAGQTVTLTATVSPSNATGTVTFNDGTNPIGTVALTNGTATFTASSLAAGQHSLTATYNGDNARAPSTSPPVSLTVNPSASITLTVSPNPASVGQTVTLTATVSPSSASGTVSFFDGTNPMGSANLSNGTATFATSLLSPGSHFLTASFAGVSSTAVTLVVKAASTTSLTASPTSATLGQTVTLTATVSPANATGNVTFFDGTNPIGGASLNNGAATLPISSLAAGSHTMTASYSGDGTFNASTSAPVGVTVGQGSTATTTSLSVSPNPAGAGQPVTLNAVVIPTSATGTVTFRDGTNPLGQATLNNVSATLVTTFQATGNHGITASYAGDSSFSASSSPVVNLVVNAAANSTQTSLSVSPNPANAGQPVTLNAVVIPTGATGTMTFKDGSTTIGAAAVNNGSATFTTSSLTAGSHTLTATYGGDSNNNPSTSNQIIEVINQTTAAVTLSGSPNPAIFGQPVALTVTISPSTATGTITIFDAFSSSFLICLTGTDCIVKNGAATLTTSNLAVGAHSLQAFYSGDANNPARESNIFVETINPATTATTTTLSATPAAATPGQTVTMTATVTGSGATGFVLFKEGSTTLGTVALNNGTATFSTSTLATGSHTVIASYTGDSKFSASSSNPVTINVGTTPCIPFPSGFVPFNSVAYVSKPNSAGDLLLAGSMSAANLATYRNLPLPAGPNQQFCGTVLLADGFPVVAYVPTSAERAGDFSPFAGLLLDPLTNQPFPGGIIPVSRIPGTFAWRIVAVLQNSTTTLSVSPATSAPGQTVTLTAIVTPFSATGTVTFLDGSTTLGTATLSGGTATLTISTLALGTHSITASYGGDAKNGPSTASPVTETVGQPPVQITGPATLPAGVVNTTYSQTFTAAGGTGTLTWSLASGSVPGLSLSAAGVLSGTPTTAGSFPLTVRVQDTAGQANTVVLTLTVNAALSITGPAALPPAFVNLSYSQTFTATGGTGTLTWSLASGSVPGLTLSAAGVLSGTPSTAGSFPLNVRVQDTAGQAPVGVFALTVNPALPPISISVTQPATITDQPAPQTSLGQGYPVALNGTYRLTFTPNAAGLPAGFTNPAVQFVTGNTSATVAIPANSTASVTLPAVQLGSVAGVITVQLASLTVASTGQSVSVPFPAPSVGITVPRLAPVIVAGSVRITSITATSFLVFLDASSTPRDLNGVGASLTFTAASGTQLNGTSFTVSLTSTAAPWFDPANATAVANGGAFSLTFLFTFSGDTTALGTVSVTLTNSVGPSAAASGGR